MSELAAAASVSVPPGAVPTGTAAAPQPPSLQMASVGAPDPPAQPSRASQPAPVPAANGPNSSATVSGVAVPSAPAVSAPPSSNPPPAPPQLTAPVASMPVGTPPAGVGAPTPRSAAAESFKSLQKKQKEAQRQERRLIKEIGRKHPEYELTAAMMLGIRTTVGSAESKAPRPLRSGDMDVSTKLWFPSAGSMLTPAHSMRDFKFKDYAPEVFRHIRERFGINPADYLLTVCGSFRYLEFISNSKSGQFFFYTHNRKFMIKTVSKGEAQFLRQILPAYYDHVMNNPCTLLAGFYGLHRVRPHKRKTFYFLVMASVFYTSRYIQSTFDLKGSLQGREVSLEERLSGNCVYKDKDFLRMQVKIKVGPARATLLKKQLRSDVEFLRSLNIMDYSLLLGISHKDRSQSPEVYTLRQPHATSQQPPQVLPLASATPGRTHVRHASTGMLPNVRLSSSGVSAGGSAVDPAMSAALSSSLPAVAEASPSAVGGAAGDDQPPPLHGSSGAAAAPAEKQPASLQQLPTATSAISPPIPSANSKPVSAGSSATAAVPPTGPILQVPLATNPDSDPDEYDEDDLLTLPRSRNGSQAPPPAAAAVSLDLGDLAAAERHLQSDYGLPKRYNRRSRPADSAFVGRLLEAVELGPEGGAVLASGHSGSNGAAAGNPAAVAHRNRAGSTPPRPTGTVAGRDQAGASNLLLAAGVDRPRSSFGTDEQSDAGVAIPHRPVYLPIDPEDFPGDRSDDDSDHEAAMMTVSAADGVVGASLLSWEQPQLLQTAAGSLAGTSHKEQQDPVEARGRSSSGSMDSGTQQSSLTPEQPVEEARPASFIVPVESIFTSDDGGCPGQLPDGRPSSEVFYLGIIDILTEFNAKKKLESTWKSIRYDKKEISAINPRDYGARFIRFLDKVIQ